MPVSQASKSYSECWLFHSVEQPWPPAAPQPDSPQTTRGRHSRRGKRFLVQRSFLGKPMLLLRPLYLPQPRPRRASGPTLQAILLGY